MTLEIKKPELEDLILELQRSGANLDEILFNSLNPFLKPAIESNHGASKRPAGRKSLADLFAASPLHGLDLDLDRIEGTLRPVDL